MEIRKYRIEDENALMSLIVSKGAKWMRMRIIKKSVIAARALSSSYLQRRQKMNQYQWLDSYLLRKAGSERDYKMEWEWQRYLVRGKMFAAVCKPDPKYKPHDGREMVILKCEPPLAELLREKYPDIVPGFYCDKANWNSIYLDGAVPEPVLMDLCDRSYQLVFAKLPKKVQREIKGE